MVFVEIVLLTAHLACMNVAAGGPIVALWLEWKDRRGDSMGAPAGRYLGAAAVIALAVGAILGVALGWLRWTPEYQQIWQVQLSKKLSNGLIELAVSGALLVAYWLWRRAAGWPTTRVGFLGRCTLAFLAGTNLLYHFPPMLIIAGKLADGGFATVNVPNEPLSGAAFRNLLGVDEIPALTAHFGLASIAMAGVALFGLALRLQKHDHEQRNAQRVATWGGWAAFIATALQVVVGLWLLATVPPTMQGQLMGNGMVPTLCFLISLGAVLWLLRELAEVTFGEVTRGAMIRSMIAMTTVVFLMTAARQLSRPTVAERAPSVSASTTLFNNR
jgi:hypothetical protein